MNLSVTDNTAKQTLTREEIKFQMNREISMLQARRASPQEMLLAIQGYKNLLNRLDIK